MAKKRHVVHSKMTWGKRMNAPILPMRFDSTEFLLLAFVVLALMAILAWQTGILAKIPFLTSSVLGASTVK